MSRALAAAAVILLLSMPACREANRSRDEPDGASVTPMLVLSPALEPRRAELDSAVGQAIGIVRSFAKRHGWDSLAAEPFMDSVMVFGDKRTFDRTLLSLVGADSSTRIPAGFCAALEQRTLVAVTPEFYAKVYPDGVEEGSYAKLLAHEMCHRLHIRILKGDEEAMGPIRFYEGFAVYAAGQLASPDRKLSLADIQRICGDPERGDYREYRMVLEHYLEKASLRELVTRAGSKGFEEWLHSLDIK